jgi:hypothetical protein
VAAGRSGRRYVPLRVDAVVISAARRRLRVNAGGRQLERLVLVHPFKSLPGRAHAWIQLRRRE